MVLVIIDYYSRYQEVKFLKTTTSAIIIGKLIEIFARLGIPKSIRVDNGRQFVSQEFKQFCDDYNIQLIQTPPYWPQANGEVENMNKSILKPLQICHANKNDYQTELQKFILMYNVTPHGTTGKILSELLFGRNIRDKIPSIMGEEKDGEAADNDILNKHKGKEKENKVRAAKETDINPGDQVMVQNVVVPNKLTPKFDKTEYVVVERKGNEVVLGKDGKIIRRHVTHVKKLPGKIKGKGQNKTCESLQDEITERYQGHAGDISKRGTNITITNV